jgi:predicted Rossmann fold flavoprotein
LITGKGRCNITNSAVLSDFLTHVHPNDKFLRYAFGRFFSEDIVNLLKRLGLNTVVERGDRVFPSTNKSSDVVNTLMKWLTKNGVELITDCRVSSLLTEDGLVKGVLADSRGKDLRLLSKATIICTGGKSYPATGSTGDGYKLAQQAGHSIVNLQQSLVPLETEGNYAERLQGLSLKNINASLWINNKKSVSEFGEMLFTHFGLSGPVILTMSRLAVDALRKNNSVEISIDLKPALDEQKLDARLIRDLNENGKKLLGSMFRQWLPASLIPVFLEILDLNSQKESHQLSSNDRKKIMLLMKDFRFRITGCRSFREAIITAGGINTNEVLQNTMESKLKKNLYFAGEVLDLDADTGGYNLQIAWSTGWLAGESAAMAIMEK